jgi:hypothetical protein
MTVATQCLYCFRIIGELIHYLPPNCAGHDGAPLFHVQYRMMMRLAAAMRRSTGSRVVTKNHYTIEYKTRQIIFLTDFLSKRVLDFPDKG